MPTVGVRLLQGGATYCGEGVWARARLGLQQVSKAAGPGKAVAGYPPEFQRVFCPSPWGVST